ncbi:hypothetical protein FRB95_008651 [Tulasnella sp. JGI-2019a]|nr:hypothetical protein FRB93_003005 [Tulasnella sp. JGI-2019a]KAG9026624.1 hypothetical protein FRB95_008651 [Tulasnella sp. JGI-2019a]
MQLPSLSPPPPMTPSLLALYRRPFGELQGFSPPRGLITPGDQVFDNAIPVETTSSGLGSGSTSVNLPLSGLSPAPVTACSTLVASPDGSFVAPVLPVCVRQPAELDAERHHIRKQLKTLRKSPYPIISKKPQANAISPVTSLDCMELSTEQKRPHQLAPRTSALKAPRKPPKFTRAVAPHLCPDFKHPTKSVRRTWTEDRINVLLEAARQFHRDWKVLDPWDQRHRSSFTDELYIRCRDIWREWFPTEDFIMTCQGLKDYVGKKDTEDLRSLSGIPALILMDEQKALEEVALRAQVASMQIAKHRVV